MKVADSAIMALDAGTTGVKAVAFDTAGGEIAVARRPSPVHRPQPAWAEQDMAACWEAACVALREAAAAAPAVRLLAVTAQGDGCWLVDAAGEPVRPAILWNDGRAQRQVVAWAADGTLEKAFALNGSIAFPGLANAALRWLAVHEPEALGRAHHLLSCGGWLFLKLTGRACAEVSDASAPFLDARRGTYSRALLDLYGLATCAPLLPPVVQGAEAVAPLTAAAAVATGLPAGLPVVLAPYDVASAALGAGALAPGAAFAVLGTTFVCGVVTETPVPAGPPCGATVALGLPGRYLRFFPTLAGVEVLDWAAGLVGCADPPALLALAMNAPPGARGLQFLPYLSPAGERAPFLDPRARGSLCSLTLAHGKADIARAVVEGLTLVLRDCLAATGAAVSSLHLSGGGTRNDRWCQLIADVTGRETRRVAASEVTARGAALAGLIATGTGIEAAAAAWAQEGGRWQPDPTLTAFYAAHYAEFCRLRALARQGWAGAPEPNAP